MDNIITREQVKDRIASGQAIVIYKGLVLKLDRWIKYHPGGDKAIHHMIGRDATDEMNAYHSDETVEQFKKWRIGIIDYKWENMLPPIQGGTFEKINQNHHNPTSPRESIDGSLDQNKSQSNNIHIKLCGEMDVKIHPRNPQGVIPSLNLKNAYMKKIITDPSDICDNFDNKKMIDDLKTFPSLDYKTQAQLSQEYNKLHKEIIDANLYSCDYFRYVKELTRIGLMFGLSYYLLFCKNQQFLSAFVLAWAWQQSVFIAHDAGHISITHHYQLDNIFGMTIASWFGGLSLGWWKRNHNVHHLVTNDPIHDPDIQHIPFFAVSTQFFNNVYSTYYEKYLWFDKIAQILIPWQHYLYYPILCFGRFNLYRLSWNHILFNLGPRNGKAAWFRYYEFAGLIFFTYWFFYLIIYCKLESWKERFQYIMVSHITTVIVHVQITLSHFAMSTSDLGVSESFPMRQLRTSMDVDCPRWLDFFHGGLQFQIVHHLFPRLPRHNLRAAQPYVLRFCEKVGIKYSIYGFSKGNNAVLSHLEEIAQQANTMIKCVKHMKQESIDEKS